MNVTKVNELTKQRPRAVTPWLEVWRAVSWESELNRQSKEKPQQLSLRRAGPAEVNAFSPDQKKSGVSPSFFLLSTNPMKTTHTKENLIYFSLVFFIFPKRIWTSIYYHKCGLFCLYTCQKYLLVQQVSLNTQSCNEQFGLGLTTQTSSFVACRDLKTWRSQT